MPSDLRAYLDHAASTPMRPEAIAAMTPFLAAHPGNPSGGHRASQLAKQAIEDARERIAGRLGCRPDEVVFTGGGSESDNLAVKGACWAARAAPGAPVGPPGVVVGAFEHKAVLAAAHRLTGDGARVAEVGAGPDGVIDLDRLAAALDPTTAVVSVMLVNNETGIVQPLREVAALVRSRAPRAVLHTDAVQAPQWLDVATAAADADLVSLSGHKFGGPKGVGVLVRRHGTALVPLVEGGGHEWGLRAGTQNVAGIVAFAAALDAACSLGPAERARIAAQRDRLEAGLHAAVGSVVVNGDPARRVQGLLHVSFPGVEAEALLVLLDQRGVDAASGSACSSGAVDPSHVLAAMGLERSRALAGVRFSLGWASQDADVDLALTVVPDAVAQLRDRAVA